MPQIEKTPILILEEAGTGLFSLLLQNMGFTNLLRVSPEAEVIDLIQESAIQLCIIDLEAAVPGNRCCLTVKSFTYSSG